MIDIPYKEYWYNWGGANTDLFYMVYGLFVKRLPEALPILDALGEHKNFHYFLLAFTALFAIKYLYRKVAGYDTSGYLFRSYAACLCTLVGSFLVMAVIITGMKEYIGFLRPYAQLADVTLLYGVADAADQSRSFPSGHVAFTALWVTLLWSQLWWFLRPFLLFTLVLMCWFRIAIGMHFPMDVVTSIIIVRLTVSAVGFGFYRAFKVKR